MVLKNLGYRPVRTALSIVAVAIEVILILSVVGLVHGLIEERAERQQGIGADILIQPTGAGAIMGLNSGGAMPVSIAGKIKADVPGVKAVTPAYLKSFGGLTIAWGIDIDSFNAVSGGFTVLSGRVIRPDTYEVMVDDIYAASQTSPLKVGDTLPLWGHDFAIVGIVASGKGGRLFVPIHTIQNVLGDPNRCTVFYVKVDDPRKDLQPVVERLKATLPGYPITSMAELYSLMVSGNIPGVKPFERIMIAIAVVIGFLVIFLAMYTTVLERTREIGTLKALGGSKAYIVGLVLRETALVAVFGVIIGIVAFVLLRHFVLRAFPDVAVQLTGIWVLWATLIAIGGSLLGAAYPATRAAKQDPIEALAYE